jgi:uncharacterized protein YjbI with pentapeptide repeats
MAESGKNDPGAEFASRWREKDEDGRTKRDAVLATLRASCTKGTPGRPRELDLRGINLCGEDLSGLDLSGYDLSGAELSGCKLGEANLSQARLCNASLYKAQLKGCEFLQADLSGANVNECAAEGAGFATADLTRASLIGADLRNTTFSHAKLNRADLRAVRLNGASIRNADLGGANFTRSVLDGADLKESSVAGATFELASLRDARLLGLVGFAEANWVGADIRGVDLRGAYLIRRHIMDENYLFEFRTRGKFRNAVYYVWWATSDCGRSLGRWGLLVASVALAYALLYTLVDIDYGHHRTAFSPVYFSVVTLTTLGYGDAVPASLMAQILVMSEAILGYVGLGGMLSILANKMARRAE